MFKLFTGPRLLAAHLLLVAATLGYGQNYLLRINSLFGNNVVAQVGAGADVVADNEGSATAGQNDLEAACADVCSSEVRREIEMNALAMRSVLSECAENVLPSDVYVQVQGLPMSCADLVGAYDQLNLRRSNGDERIQLAHYTSGDGGPGIVPGVMMEPAQVIEELDRCITFNDGFTLETEAVTTESVASDYTRSVVSTDLESSRRQTLEELGQTPVDVDNDGRFDTTLDGLSGYVSKISGSVCPEVLTAVRAQDSGRLTKAVKDYLVQHHERELEAGPKVFDYGLSTLYDTLCPGAEASFRSDFYRLLTGQEEDIIVRLRLSKLESSSTPALSSSE